MAGSLNASQGLRVAVEGCGHGVLHAIYASVDKACEEAGWPGVDVLIIGGDFQAVRNADDLACVSMPAKYWSMQDFHEYYSGARKAPYLTIFVGGNHEASNHMFELYYGGWVAPNIYYMGAANVLRVGPLRIAGMSGIWKGYDYKKPHFERLPYSQDELKSIYHTRELDVRKLLCLRSQVDVGISHDWPRGVEWQGNHKSLFNKKSFLRDDAENGRLGSVAARYVLDRLRPAYWFSAHLHVKFSALVKHDTGKADASAAHAALSEGLSTRQEDKDEIALDQAESASLTANGNADEIDLDMSDEDASQPVNGEGPHGMNGAPEPVTEDGLGQKPASVMPDEVRAQLPAAFTQARPEPVSRLPFPAEITNTSTKFLALDKCLPDRSFLQLVSIPSTRASSESIPRPVRLCYDPEWLAITRVFASDLQLGDPHIAVAHDKGDAFYRPMIEKELEWVLTNLADKDLLEVPENFAATAPVYDHGRGMSNISMPRECTNPQTSTFCDLLQIPNPFDISETEREERRARGPRPGGSNRYGETGGHGGGGGSRGGGRGRGKGGFGRGGRRGGRGRSGW